MDNKQGEIGLKVLEKLADFVEGLSEEEKWILFAGFFPEKLSTLIIDKILEKPSHRKKND